MPEIVLDAVTFAGKSLPWRKKRNRCLVLGLVMGVIMVCRPGAWATEVVEAPWMTETWVRGQIAHLFDREFVKLDSDQHWVTITLKDIVNRVLKENLSILITRRREAIAREGVAVSRSAFDPTVTLSSQYGRSSTKTRVEHDSKWFNGTQSCNEAIGDAQGYCQADATSPGADVPVYRFMNSSVPIAFVRYTEEFPPGPKMKTIKASKAGVGGDTESVEESVTALIPLPWGARVSVTPKLRSQGRDYVLNADSAKPIVGSYDRPWTSAVSATVSTPLPGSRYFGRLSPLDVAQHQARLSLDKMGATARGEVNELLLEVETAFWDLVVQTRMLAELSARMEVMERLTAKTQEMERQRRVSTSDRLQMETTLAEVRAKVHGAWRDTRLASNILNGFLRFDEELLYFPVAVDSLLFGKVDHEWLAGLGDRLGKNPRLEAEGLAVDAARLNLAQKRQGMHPQASVDVTVSASQSGSAFGYESSGQALGHIADPDGVSVTTTVSLNHEWDNRKARAALGQAQAEEGMTESGQRITKNQLRRRFSDALAGLESAQVQTRMALERLRMASRTVERAERFAERRRIGEYELIMQHQELADAEGGVIRARVGIRKAEASVLATVGLLGEHRLADEQK